MDKDAIDELNRMMAIRIDAYRSSIGIFGGRARNRPFVFPSKVFKDSHNFLSSLREWSKYLCKVKHSGRAARGYLHCSLGFSIIFHMLILLCGVVQTNPGPDFLWKDISICQANT